MKTVSTTVLLRQITLSCAALVAATAISMAQETIGDSSDQKKMEEIIEMSPFQVSEKDDDGYRARQTMAGSRSALDLIDLPVSVNIINAEQISDLGANSIHDVLRYTVSGVTQNQSFNDDVNIRGFRALNPLRNGAQRNATNKGTPLYDIERVEVLKGPAAMLNGSNGGIGGAINYISRQPSAVVKGEAKVSLADTGAVRVEANAAGPLYSSDDLKVNYRLTLGGLKSDAPRGKTIEWEDQKFYGGALGLYFGNGSSLTVSGYYFINNDYLYLQDFFDITVPKDPTTGLTKAVFNQYSTESYSTGRQEDAFWPLKSTFIDVTYLTQLTENTNVRAVYYYNRTDDRRLNNRGITVQADNYTVNRQDVRNNNGVVAHSVQVDLLNKWDLGWMKIDTTIGVDAGTSYHWEDQFVATNPPAIDSRTGQYPDDDAWYAQFNNDDDYFINPPAGVNGSPSRRQDTVTSVSYYFQESLSFWEDRIILVGGLRWFNPGSERYNLVTDVITKNEDKDFRVHKYGAVFKVLPTVSLYYTNAQNVFAAAIGNVDKEVAGDKLGEPFKDQLGKLNEGGVKFDYSLNENVKFYGSLAVFQMEQTNLVTNGVLPNGNPGTVQSAKDSAEGWETDIGMQFRQENGKADVILTYFDGDSAIAADEGKAYVRQTHGFVPQKFSVLAKYTWTGGSLKGFRLGMGVETEADKRNGAYLIEHPLLADAFFGYTFSNHLDLQLNLSNITDERYVIQAAASGLNQGSDTFRAKLAVSYKW